MQLPPPQPKTPATIAQQVVETAKSPPQQAEQKVSWRNTVSTGSLLLDLAISGGKTKYGGLPGGMIMEISGPPGSGKTTMGAELVGSAQRQGGEIKINDPEARLDAEYCRKMGAHLPMIEKDGLLIPNPKFYGQPDTVTDVIEELIGPLEAKDNKTRRNHDKAWKPDPSHINCNMTDSLAALSTKMEMEQGDKMGQRRAKELSEGMRVIARHISKHNILMVCTNQLRDNVDGGQFAPKKITPGGNAIPFYASVRLQITIMQTLKKDKDSDPYGKILKVYVSKNSKDIEYRSALVRLIFGYGIDDLGSNLMFLKKHGELSVLPDGSKSAGYAIGDQVFPVNTKGGALEAAVGYCEEQNIEQDIRELVVEVWNRLEAESRPMRKEKVR